AEEFNFLRLQARTGIRLQDARVTQHGTQRRPHVVHEAVGKTFEFGNSFLKFGGALPDFAFEILVGARAVIAGNLAGLKIAIPGAQAGGFQSKAQAFLAVTQGGFGFVPRVHHGFVIKLTGPTALRFWFSAKTVASPALSHHGKPPQWLRCYPTS